MTLEEVEATQAIEIWPDNLQSVNVFISMSTQWRVGNSGATGLDYNSLPVVMDFVGVAKVDCSQVFEDIRVMEDSALSMMKG